MEEDVFLAADLADFGDGLDDSDFVVGGHDADEDGRVVDGAAQFFEIYESVGAYGQVSDATAGVFEPVAGVENGFVLRDLGDDVVAALAVGLGDALERE